jgi:hypothetical protein
MRTAGSLLLLAGLLLLVVAAAGEDNAKVGVHRVD